MICDLSIYKVDKKRSIYNWIWNAQQYREQIVYYYESKRMAWKTDTMYFWDIVLSAIRILNL